MTVPAFVIQNLCIVFKSLCILSISSLVTLEQTNLTVNINSLFDQSGFYAELTGPLHIFLEQQNNAVPYPDLCTPYLHSGLREADAQRQLLSHEDVRIVRLGETSLKLIELRWREARAVALLLLGLARGLVLVAAAVLLLLGLVLLLVVYRTRRGARAAADVVTREHCGTLHTVRSRTELPGVAWVRQSAL